MSPDLILAKLEYHDRHEREETGRDHPAAKSLSEQRANRSENRDQRKSADTADR
jgi:hypothetical protein